MGMQETSQHCRVITLNGVETAVFRTRNALHFEREQGSHILPAERILNERTHDTNNVCNREGALKRCNIWDNVSRVEQEKAQSGLVIIIPLRIVLTTM